MARNLAGRQRPKPDMHPLQRTPIPRWRRSLFPTALLFLVCLGVAGRPPAATAVAFTPLAGGAAYTANLAAPVLLLAATAAQGARLARLTDQPEVEARLVAVDFATTRLLGVFAGPMGSSGHGIAVTAIHVGPDAVQVTVSLSQPRPGQNVADVITYPYAIVAVPRAALPAAVATQWSAVTADGRRLAEDLGALPED